MTDPAHEESVQRAWRRGLLALVALCLAVYGPLVAAGHVFDDDLLLVQNTELRSLARPWRFFVQPLWEGTPRLTPPGMYHRPLAVLSFAVDHALFGLHAGPAHLHSLVWHLGAVGALAVLLQRIGVGPAAGLLGVALFALHPVQVEAVAFLSARNDLMAAALLLGGLAALVRERVRWGGVGALFLGACLSKESALLAAAMVPLLALSRPDLPRRRWAVGVGIAGGCAAATVGLRLLSGIGWPPQVSWARLEVAAPQALAWWAEALIWPVARLPAMHLAWPPEPSWLALGLAAAGCGLVAARAGRRGMIGLALFLLSLAPAVLGVVHTGQVPHRYLYLPVAGLGLMLAVAGDRWLRRPGAAAVVALGLAVLAGRAVPIWQSDRSLWGASVAEAPTPFAEAALAKTLELEGDLEAATVHYRRALAPYPPASHACWNIARLQLQRGNLGGAAQDGEAALEAGCARDPELLAPTAIGHLASGGWDRAAQLADEVGVGADPTGQAVLVRLAVAYHRGDRGGVAAVAGPDPRQQRALAAQLERLLQVSGDTAALALLHRDLAAGADGEGDAGGDETASPSDP